MTTLDKQHELREHLAVISTAAYLMKCSTEEEERTERYNMVQEQIDAILSVIENHNPMQHSCLDIKFN